VIRRLVEAGYRVRSNFPVGHYRIDIVVDGTTKRLAVECDGDRYHPIEKLDEDLARQEILERLGWRFARIRGTAFFSDPSAAMRPVFEKLEGLQIERLGPAGERQETPAAEVIARVTRRAAELRMEWAAEEAEGTVPAASLVQPRRGYWRLAHDAIPPDELEAASNAILGALTTAGCPLGRGEILRLTGISENVWHAAIRRLSEAGRVLSRGEKRGTKWELDASAVSINSPTQARPDDVARASGQEELFPVVPPEPGSRADASAGPSLQEFLDPAVGLPVGG
jgi:very-short-patch-repair endonuclease